MDDKISIILPIFNATDKQAEMCINSIISSFINKNYKLLIITNREIDVFKNDLFKEIPHVIFKKNIFSLPEAYTTLVNYAKKHAIDENAIITLMDDDAYILNGQNDKVDECIKRLDNDKYLISSGHYYDITPPKTKFEHMVNASHTKNFSMSHQKPYCHGGASFMIKLKNFPELTTKGLGGISVNILTMEKANDYNYWPLYNDATFQVFHPRKNNLFAWIATYLSYEIAWGNALDLLDNDTLNKWKIKLKETSDNRVLGLYQGLNNPQTRIYYLGNIYLTKFLKPLLKDYLNYEDFKKYKVNTHINLR